MVQLLGGVGKRMAREQPIGPRLPTLHSAGGGASSSRLEELVELAAQEPQQAGREREEVCEAREHDYTDFEVDAWPLTECFA